MPHRRRGDLARRRAAVVMARGSGVSSGPMRKIVLMGYANAARLAQTLVKGPEA